MKQAASELALEWRVSDAPADDGSVLDALAEMLIDLSADDTQEGAE